jgi:hypothetical protein
MRIIDQLYRNPLASPVPESVWIGSCGSPSLSLPTFRRVRFRRMTILVSATLWSPPLHRHGHPIWSRWARIIDTIDAVTLATCLSLRGKWLACTSDVSGGRWIAVGGSGRAYVTGYTPSADYPTTPGAFDTTYNGDVDAFVTKLRTG